MRKKILCLGGGTAMPNAVLEGIKKCPFDIATAASMLESGGSSGQLRVDFQTLPWGDIRRHLLVLSEAPDWKKKIFQLRIGREEFDDGHKGHPFGNIFLCGVEYVEKNLEKTLAIAHAFLEVKGSVFPISTDLAHIYAVLENGEVVFGEDEIDVPKKHNPNLKIKEIRLTKKVGVYLPVLEAIKQADLITIGPGDLYSSLLPCFLPNEIKEAFKNTKAKKVLIVNAMTKLGETNDFSVLDFTNEVEKYLSCPLDFVIYNTEIPNKKRIGSAKKDDPSLLNLVKIDASLKSKQIRNKFLGRDILASSGPIVYDPRKVAQIIKSLCGL